MSRPRRQRAGRPRQGPETAQPPRGQRSDAGQMTVLIIGFVLLALLLTTVVVAASSIYIEHKKLLSLADGASVAAADSFTLGQLETGGGSPTAVLTGARVRGAAVEFLDRSSASARFRGLALGPGTGSPDGSTAVVVLSAAVHPPVVNFLVPDGIRIEASSTARSQLTR